MKNIKEYMSIADDDMRDIERMANYHASEGGWELFSVVSVAKPAYLSRPIQAILVRNKPIEGK